MALSNSGIAGFVLGCVHILCTLYLSITLLMAKRETGLRASWKSNSKDVLLGLSSGQSQASWTGRPRTPPLRKRDVSKFVHFWVVIAPNILFRRIVYVPILLAETSEAFIDTLDSPVETKRYAFFQNFTALLFIIVLIVRAIMALTQAQNQIETRTGTELCIGLPYIHTLQVLVVRPSKHSSRLRVLIWYNDV
jgi:hypothetical protein